jgi:hypothetical protein
MRTFWLLSGTIFLCASVPASADPARDALAEITKCADIADAAERLKCFDAATVGAKTALAAPPPAAPAAPVQQASVQTEEKEEEGGVLSWFGLSRPVTKSEDFGKPSKPVGPKEITEISAGVLEFAKNPLGRSIFILDNGQIWKQIDGDNTEVAEPKRGEAMKVSIETAVFGSYALRIEGRRGIVKVRRLK